MAMTFDPEVARTMYLSQFDALTVASLTALAQPMIMCSEQFVQTIKLRDGPD